MTQSQFHVGLSEPGSKTTVLGSWPGTAPIPMAVGDVLHTGALLTDAPPSRLRVVRVERALWLRDGVLAHKCMVFTEPA